ncbi:MAG: sensor domain-containing diguanylate cyclase [Chloroflexota bacterium]|nr:sensor domain-containing diguanylate cyclase [Chloroflexota bacterium]
MTDTHGPRVHRPYAGGLTKRQSKRIEPEDAAKGRVGVPPRWANSRRFASRLERLVASPWSAVLLIALLIALPVLVMGQLAENSSRERSRTGAQAQLDEGATLGAGIIAERIADVRIRAETVASRGSLRQAVAAGDAGAIVAILADRGPLFGDDVQRIFVLDLTGTMLAIEPPAPETVGKSFAHREYFTGVSRNWTSYVSGADASGLRDGPAVVVATPLRDTSGRPVGLIAALIDVGQTRAWLAPLGTGFDDVYLLDQKGTIVFAQADAQNASVLRDVSTYPSVSAMLAGATVQGEVSDLLDGSPSLVAAATVSGIGWHVIVGRSPTLLEASAAEVSRAFVWLRLALLSALLVAGFVLSRTTMRLLRATQRQALTDGLTGLYNRRHLERELRALTALAKRGGQPFSILAMDLDGLKALNDRRGHAAGDVALQLVARALEHSIRPYDIAVRTGGDEFVVVLPQTNTESATVVAARVRARIRESAAALAAPGIDTSVGVATWHRGMSADAVVAVADAHLYEAKQLGKGRVVSSAKPGTAAGSRIGAI